MATGELVVTCNGQDRVVRPPDTLVFGRGPRNDINLGDTNKALHRRVGRFFARDGIWSLRNEGTSISMFIHDAAGASMLKLVSGGSAIVPFVESIVRFQAADHRYEIVVEQSLESSAPPVEATTADADQTKNPAGVPLRGEQRLLVVALCESVLRDPHASLVLPSSRQIQRRFGWTESQFDGKLQRLCEKFTRWGFPGLVGELCAPATNRRQRLAEHAINWRLVSASDLELIDAATVVAKGNTGAIPS